MKVEQIEWRLEPLKIGDVLGTSMSYSLVACCWLLLRILFHDSISSQMWTNMETWICNNMHIFSSKNNRANNNIKKSTTIHEWTQLSDYLSQPVEDLNSTWYHLCLTFFTKNPACESHPTHLTSSLACEQKLIHQAFNFSTWIFGLFEMFQPKDLLVSKVILIQQHKLYSCSSYF